LVQRLRTDPLGITYRELGGLGICGVQVFGCFCIGEIIGRKSIIGYDLGGPNPYHEKIH